MRFSTISKKINSAIPRWDFHSIHHHEKNNFIFRELSENPRRDYESLISSEIYSQIFSKYSQKAIPKHSTARCVIKRGIIF